MPIEIALNDAINTEEVVDLYKANQWSSAEKPKELLAALRNSHSLITACRAGKLIGIGNAISDGHLVVYFPHLLVHPRFQGQGVGKKMMAALLERYAGFHPQMLSADGGASASTKPLVSFARARPRPCGFMPVMSIKPMQSSAQLKPWATGLVPAAPDQRA
jgi:GNAT superfamily N-acetyltransferase